MILTIGMIVKNEEKYLERCLTSIKPILDNVESELIVTDTGSTDRTVEIAEIFTDKVLHFKWVKDFSAARNTALQIASGEWFMFLDADEIFESCDNIIDFFNSGDYKKYKSASFVIRNLYDEQNYLDFLPRRMVKRYPDTKFVGIIHEYIYPILEPSKHIGDIALHYGYLYTSIKETQAKFDRNIELMLKTLKEEKSPHPRIYSLLFDGYCSVSDFEQARKYLEIGIEKCKEKNDGYIVVLYDRKADQLYHSGYYEETYMVCEEYFSEKKRMKLPILTTDGEMYAYGADSLFALDKCEEAINYYKNYLETLKQIKSGKIHTEDAHQILFTMCSDRTFPGIFNNFSACCINTNEFSTADIYFTSYPITEYTFKDDALVTLCSRMITVLEHTEYKNITKYVSRLNERGRSLLIDMLFIRMYISSCDQLIYHALKKITTEDIKEKVKLFYYYFRGGYTKDVLQNAVVQIIICANHSLELRKANCGSLFVIRLDKSVEDISMIGRLAVEKAYDELNDAMRAAVIFNESIMMRRNGHIKACISKMKDAVKEYEPIAPIVNEYCNSLVDGLEKASPDFEMNRLALKVKNNIKAMIDSGKYEHAKKTLYEYRQINPKDTDIEEYEAMLQGK